LRAVEAPAAIPEGSRRRFRARTRLKNVKARKRQPPEGTGVTAAAAQRYKEQRHHCGAKARQRVPSATRTARQITVMFRQPNHVGRSSTVTFLPPVIRRHRRPRPGNRYTPAAITPAVTPSQPSFFSSVPAPPPLPAPVSSVGQRVGWGSRSKRQRRPCASAW